jgi:hypothetical protein
MGDLWATYGIDGEMKGRFWGDFREVLGRFGGGLGEILGRFQAKRQGKLAQFLCNPSRCCIFVAD